MGRTSGTPGPYARLPEPGEWLDVHDLVRSLPPRLKLVAESLMRDMSQREVAQRLGITQQSVSLRIQKIREKALVKITS